MLWNVDSSLSRLDDVLPLFVILALVASIHTDVDSSLSLQNDGTELSVFSFSSFLFFIPFFVDSRVKPENDVLFFVDSALLVRMTIVFSYVFKSEA